MNREELDEFLARSEDVLDDWDGSADSMTTMPPVPAWLDLLDSVDHGPTREHLRSLASFFQDDADAARLNWLYNADIMLALRHVPIINPRSLIIVRSVA